MNPTDDKTKAGMMGVGAASAADEPTQTVTDPMTDPTAGAAPVTPPADSTVGTSMAGTTMPPEDTVAEEPVEPMGTTTMTPTEVPVETPVAPVTGVAGTTETTDDDTTGGTGTGSQVA